MIRYCDDLHRPYAERLAADLRRDGDYLRVVVRTERPDEDGRPFASIWVDPAPRR